MKDQPKLDVVSAKKLAEELNDLIAYLHIFYMNIKVFQWNIKGNNYFEMSLTFEKAYGEAILSKIEEIAEQILELGFIPDYSFSSYLKKSSIEPITGSAKANNAVKDILESSQVIAELERKLLAQAVEFKEEKISSMMRAYISDQDKYAVSFSGNLV
jgi:starvation-inducible DNA-binding protein